MKTKIDIEAVKELINNFNIEYFDIKSNMLKNSPMNYKDRNRKLVLHRQVVYHFLFSNGYNKSQIGRIFDNAGKEGIVDHATVLYGIAQFKQLLKQNNKELIEVMEVLSPMLNECYLPVEEKIDAKAENKRLDLGFTTHEIDIINCEDIHELMLIKRRLISEFQKASQIHGKFNLITTTFSSDEIRPVSASRFIQ